MTSTSSNNITSRRAKSQLGYFVSCLPALLLIIFMIYFAGIKTRENASSSDAFRKDFTGKKIIVSWTRFFGGLLDDKYFDNCPELRNICELTTDRYHFRKADALVFHPPDMRWTRIPPVRTPDQRYVYLLHESPSFHALINLDRIPYFFNWSMTYRLDADVPYPYSYLTPDPSAAEVLDRDAILNKSSTSVAWFVSNCETASKRKWYVRILQNFITVDIYGRCGESECPKGDKQSGSVVGCEEELLNKKYKFYLAFENSVCRDYVTEKVYRRWRFKSVPIVLSRRVAQPLLPPNSFVSADDFPEGPKQLAEYLKYLMKNDTEYLKYFKWKTVGYSESKRNPTTGQQWGFCGLCEKLWKMGDGSNQEYKAHKSVYSWWGEEVSCDNDLVNRLIFRHNSSGMSYAWYAGS